MRAVPRAHPNDATLLAYAAGRLGPAFRVAVRTHAAGCARCAMRLGEGVALGGALLDAEAPAPMSGGALEAALARLDAPAPRRPRQTWMQARTWPVAPGVRHALLVAEDDESLHLFRVRPNASLPAHDHGGPELTCVLEGKFRDSAGEYAAGDAVAMRPGLDHEPVATGTAECVCLLAVQGRLRFRGLLPRLAQHLLRL